MKDTKNNLETNSVENDIKELKDFLLHIDCLDKLSEWTTKFNMFDVLKISDVEIRHSNMLAWLLNPNENHGLGSEIIRRFIQFSADALLNNDDEIFNILLKDFDDFIIYRERRHIDILAVSDSQKIVLCIENKIFSSEHANQLQRYYDDINKEYKDYTKLFIYLTPDGDESSDNEHWASLDYDRVCKFIEESRKHKTESPDIKLFIDNYLDAIRRKVMGDKRLEEICASIYSKYWKAIELINNYKPDKASELSEIFRKWANEKTKKGEIELVFDNCEKKYTRFKTKAMSKILPDDNGEHISGWGTLNHYFYEIVNNNGESYYIKLVLNSTNISDELMEKCNRVYGISKKGKLRSKWVWLSLGSTFSKKVDKENDYDEEEIMKNLDLMLKEMMDFQDKIIKEF